MLTSEEEKTRMKLTWQDFDYTLDLLALRPDEVHNYVTDYGYWNSHVEDLVIEFEDEIPLWVGLRRAKCARDATENQAANRNKRKSNK